MPQIKAVLFDLDGTLTNTLDDLAASTNYALERFGYPTHEIAKYRYFVGNGARKLVERALPEAARTSENIDRLLDAFLEHYSVHSLDTTAPYDGVMELIDELRRREMSLGIVTNKPDAAAQEIVADFFGDRFDFILGQRDGIPTKPAPDMPLYVMRQLGLSPEECLFVGDSGVDILTGAACGAYPVGVLWGFRDEAELRENGAEQVISHPRELLEVIDRLNGGN